MSAGSQCRGCYGNTNGRALSELMRETLRAMERMENKKRQGQKRKERKAYCKGLQWGNKKEVALSQFFPSLTLK